jgi:hypothetical protein
MTLWCGLLSCLFVVPVPANSGPKFKVDANRLVADALIAETGVTGVGDPGPP